MAEIITAHFSSYQDEWLWRFELRETEMVEIEGHPVMEEGGTNRYVTSREDVRLAFEGYRFVLYGFTDEQPEQRNCSAPFEYCYNGDILNVRMGCQHFVGEDARKLRAWALGVIDAKVDS